MAPRKNIEFAFASGAFTLRGAGLHVDSANALLRQKLAVQIVEATPAGPTGVQVVRTVLPLAENLLESYEWRRSVGGHVPDPFAQEPTSYLAGLAPAAADLLCRHGYRVTISPDIDRAPSLAGLYAKPTGAWFDGFESFLREHPRGRIRFPASINTAVIAAAIVSRYRGEPSGCPASQSSRPNRILVLLQHQKDAEAVEGHLTHVLGKCGVHLLRDGATGDEDEGWPIVVGRPLAASNLDKSSFSLVLLVQPQFILGAGIQDCLDYHSARLIGLQYTTPKLTHEEEWRLARWLGHESLTIRDLKLGQRPIEWQPQFLFCPDRPTKGSSAFERRRVLAVRNQSRNHLIGALARFLGAPAGASPGRGISEAIVKAKTRFGRQARVLVVVGSVEHAVELAGLHDRHGHLSLPNAGLVIARDVLVDDLEDRLPDLHERLRLGRRLPSLLIATASALKSITPDSYDVVIVADGQKDSLPESLWRVGYAGGSRVQAPLLCVDVAPQASLSARWKPDRLKQYLDQTGWRLRDHSHTNIIVSTLNGSRRAAS